MSASWRGGVEEDIAPRGGRGGREKLGEGEREEAGGSGKRREMGTRSHSPGPASATE